ncbi:signal recognition particle subunit srp68 [Coemansia sp. RSA 2399]|nr:signal recognition particle subunit srp68 [Coemansia sp. RSA 2399]KAJ1906370.1 signal recognition particle subunit srp68 [Coemansia sp. IMI 209127]
MAADAPIDQSSVDKGHVAFDIFGYVHKSRQTYGIRAQDYMRYRRYCAHHLRNVRKAAKLSQGSSTAYKPKAVTVELASEPKHIEILVLQAERAWAFAMDLRELYSRTEEPRQHYHLVRRLRAACKAGRQLADIAHVVCDLHTALAASAYWLHIQSQLSFEMEEWEVAMDSAVFSRIVSEQLAISGNSERYALCHAMIEELDPIVRLAAYQSGMRSAQQTPPSEVAAQWYESRMKGNASRAEKSILGYGLLAAELEKLMSKINSEDAGSGLVDIANAHKLAWRNGSIVFADKELASLLALAQGAVKDCTGSDDGVQMSLQSVAATDPTKLDPTVASFRRVTKSARRCYADGVSAAEKIGSSASDLLLSSYLAIQLYSMCLLHAALVAKNVGRAQALAKSNGVSLDSPAPVFAKADAAWMPDHTRSPVRATQRKKGKHARTTKRGSRKGGMTGAVLPELTEIVILYDMARKSMGRLKSAVSDVLNKISPAVGRTIHAYKVIDEISTAEAYYSCVRGYYAVVLHAHPRHKKYVDALALADKALNEYVPEALSLLASSDSKHAVSASGTSAADVAWGQVFLVTNNDLSQAKTKLEVAMESVRGFCAAATDENLTAAHSSPAKKSWHDDPSARPRMIPNTASAALTSNNRGDEPIPTHVPSLVDFSSLPFVAVPMKPLFYDLAAPAIDFDMATIEEKAGKQAAGGSKLGSIIGSLWGR